MASVPGPFSYTIKVTDSGKPAQTAVSIVVTGTIAPESRRNRKLGDRATILKADDTMRTVIDSTAFISFHCADRPSRPLRSRPLPL
jgi:hypothetical protein